ncbi:MAG: DinB family protein [Chloroflexi bacterium]|nr:DinB family protein [Chloroflexota bacterium]
MEQFFEDYLQALQTLSRDFQAAIAGLPVEALDWVPGTEMNSLCALVVHTTAAARFWIGDVALGEDSRRDRDAEFKARGMSAVDLAARFAALEDYARAALPRITLADLSAQRPVPNRSMTTTAGWAILHALEHTSLHLGHAQIMRQLWDQNLT